MSLESTQKEMQEARDKVAVLEKKTEKFEDLENEIELLKERNKQMEKKMLSIESYSRKENVIIEGLPETANENPFKAVATIFTLLDLGNIPLQRCHRLGHQKPRKMIVRFANFQDKVTVMKNASKLKETTIFLRDDYPAEIQERRLALWPLYKYAKSKDDSTKLIQDQIHYREQSYGIDTINQMPIQLDETCIVETDSEVLFAGEHTPLSNWFNCKIEYNKAVFTSAEHLFQFRKCTVLGQHEVADQIFRAKTPRKAMLMGKAVKVPVMWTETTGKELMAECIAQKIQQVYPFKQALQKYAKKRFVESTRNKVWGSGIPLADPDAPIKSKWTGKNLLGSIYNDLVTKL